MAINSFFYINAATLDLATSVYLDSALTLLAPNGYYSDGSITRQQSSGILLAEETCIVCPVDCEFKDDFLKDIAIYTINVNLSKVKGAVIVYFDTGDQVDGIRVTYDSVTYNKLSSPLDGVHQSPTYGQYTVVGLIDNDCDLTGNTTVFADLQEYGYSTSGWYLTGNTDSIIINPADVSLSSSNPNTFVMVIPKPNEEPTILNVQILNPCGIEGGTVVVECPAALEGFESSIKYETENVPCGELTMAYYVAQVHYDDGFLLGLYDYVFTDPNGQYPLDDGWYRVSTGDAPNNVMKVENGVIVEFLDCTEVVLELAYRSTPGNLTYSTSICSEDMPTGIYIASTTSPIITTGDYAYNTNSYGDPFNGMDKYYHMYFAIGTSYDEYICKVGTNGYITVMYNCIPPS